MQTVNLYQKGEIDIASKNNRERWRDRGGYHPARGLYDPDNMDDGAYTAAKSYDGTKFIVINMRESEGNRSKKWKVDRISPGGRPTVNKQEYGSRNEADMAAKAMASMLNGAITARAIENAHKRDEMRRRDPKRRQQPYVSR